MILLREKHANYICLIAFILIQLFEFNSADGEIACVQCGFNTNCSEKEITKPCPNDTNTYNKCYTQIDTNGKIERGCRKVGDENSCKIENNCVISDNGKNTQLICKKCDGSDEKCSQTDMILNEYKYNQICNEGVKSCFVKVDNKLIVRDCASDSSKCTDVNTCKTCDSDNCNSGIYPPKRIECYQCSGSSCNDVTANNITSKPCLKYEQEDDCYTIGDSETNMIRGCKSDSNENKCASSNMGCSFCKSDNCNNLKYKRNPELKCHQCTDNSTNGECFKTQTNQSFKDCEKEILYNQTGYCYTLYTDGKIQRGCLYDNTALNADNCKDGNDNACNKCNQTNGCNSENAKLTCIVCRSDLQTLCWNDAHKFKGQECRTNVDSTEGCFHGIWNGVAIRGCVVDASIQTQELCKDQDNRQCNVCLTKDCNQQKSSAVKGSLSFALILIVLTALWYSK